MGWKKERKRGDSGMNGSGIRDGGGFGEGRVCRAKRVEKREISNLAGEAPKELKGKQN